MITIYASTSEEYDKAMEFAQNYTCGNMPFRICEQYAQSDCDTCYMDNHIKIGINVFRIVDDKGGGGL